MKFVALLVVSIFSVSTYADYQGDLRNTLENAKPVNFKSNPNLKFKKIGIKKGQFIKAEDDVASEAKKCLKMIYTNQVAYFVEKNEYFTSLSQFEDGTKDCQAKFNFYIKADASTFEIQASSGDNIWQIDQDKKITKL